MPKTGAERSREYRQKKREEKMRNNVKKTTKSSTERVRNFREQRKLIKTINHQNDSTLTNSSNFIEIVPGVLNSDSSNACDTIVISVPCLPYCEDLKLITNREREKREVDDNTGTFLGDDDQNLLVPRLELDYESYSDGNTGARPAFAPEFVKVEPPSINDYEEDTLLANVKQEKESEDDDGTRKLLSFEPSPRPATNEGDTLLANVKQEKESEDDGGTHEEDTLLASVKQEKESEDDDSTHMDESMLVPAVKLEYESDCDGNTEIPEDITKRNAINCRNYRERKKMANRDVAKRKTNSDYCQMDRQRKNFLADERQSEDEVSRMLEPQPVTTVVETCPDITQRNKIYCKNYREKKKLAKQHVVKVKQTNSDYCRTYRQRKKLPTQELQSEDEVSDIPTTLHTDMTLEPQPITDMDESVLVPAVKLEYESDCDGNTEASHAFDHNYAKIHLPSRNDDEGDKLLANVKQEKESEDDDSTHVDDSVLVPAVKLEYESDCGGNTDVDDSVLVPEVKLEYESDCGGNTDCYHQQEPTNTETKRRPLSNAERQRRYKERRKALKMQARTSPPNVTQANDQNESTKASTTEVQTIKSRKTKKTNAQKCREYRERKKLQSTMVQNKTAERSGECTETDQLPAKKPKTDAERRKKYYEAQKLKKQKIKKIPKTDKQRQKEYYYRKKKLQALNALNHHSDVAIQMEVVADAHQQQYDLQQQSQQNELSTKRALSNAERQRRYRERKKEKEKEERRYRERKKEKKKEERRNKRQLENVDEEERKERERRLNRLRQERFRERRRFGSPNTSSKEAQAERELEDLLMDVLLKRALTESRLDLERGPAYRGKRLYTEGTLRPRCSDNHVLKYNTLNTAVSETTLPSEEHNIVKKQVDIPKKIRCGILIPGIWDKPDDIGRTLAYQNPWVKVEKWLLHAVVKRETDTFLVVSIPEDQIPTILSHERRLGYMLGSVYIKFQGQKGKFTKTLPGAEGNSSAVEPTPMDITTEPVNKPESAPGTSSATTGDSIQAGKATELTSEADCDTSLGLGELDKEEEGDILSPDGVPFVKM